MKYTTGIAAALLCALPLSGAFAWTNKSSSKADTGYGSATAVHNQTQGSNNAGLTQPSYGADRSLSPQQRRNEYGPAASNYAGQNGDRAGFHDQGTNGNTIRNAQQALAQAGADVPQNGRLGPETERAILNYQVLHQLPITGQLDQQTLRSLDVS
jgi:peptidoglycan hydrolase-like protein with peptidoglycan-binding domain